MCIFFPVYSALHRHNNPPLICLVTAISVSVTRSSVEDSVSSDVYSSGVDDAGGLKSKCVQKN